MPIDYSEPENYHAMYGVILNGGSIRCEASPDEIRLAYIICNAFMLRFPLFTNPDQYRIPQQTCNLRGSTIWLCIDYNNATKNSKGKYHRSIKPSLIEQIGLHSYYTCCPNELLSFLPKFLSDFYQQIEDNN